MMKDLLQNITYPPLIIAVIFLGLAPFSPAPHLFEKIRMLFHGSLTRPIDLFDLLFHLAPSLLLLLKWVFRPKSEN